MTDSRLQQITAVLERFHLPDRSDAEDSWMVRLWHCCGGNRGMEPALEQETDLLFHECLTFVAQSNAEGYVGEQYLAGALAMSLNAPINLTVDSEVGR